MPILSRLSKTFQKENLNFGSVKPSILKATKSITNLRIQSESGKADWQNELIEWETEFHDGSLQGRNEASFLATFVTPFIAAIQNNLSDRFPAADVDILSAGEVFEPSKIPSADVECYSYGRDKITSLAQHFHVDVKNAVSEWKEVVMDVKDKS